MGKYRKTLKSKTIVSRLSERTNSVYTKLPSDPLNIIPTADGRDRNNKKMRVFAMSGVNGRVSL